MSRPSKITRENIVRAILKEGDLVSASRLATVLGVDRTTIVRKLGALGDDLISVGKSRGTRYGLRREVGLSGNSWPVYRIDPDGRSVHWATLESLHDRIWRVEWGDAEPEWAGRFSDSNGIWDGFPFFLNDVRPQGFLGRAIARQLSPLIGVSEDPRRWSDDDTVVYLKAAGVDVPGALVVGDECLRQMLELGGDDCLDQSDRSRKYPELAGKALISMPGSSAGGEQPKFLVRVRNEANGKYQPVLVKFSPPKDQEAGRRWADLLACEFLALRILAKKGFAAVGANLVEGGDRRFLEVPRFDRVDEKGRRGVISLAALHPESESLGEHSAWTHGAENLKNEGLIAEETCADIRRLHAFGGLIGNSDRHAGNLAFWFGDTLPFQLAPVYDMLPMLWSPGPQGELVARRFQPSASLPAFREEWEQVVPWAEDFWNRVTDHTGISSEFQRIASDAAKWIEELKK